MYKDSKRRTRGTNMVEVDAMDRISLKNASLEELREAFLKYDRYFDYGPRLYKKDYLRRLNNILEEIRQRKGLPPK